MKANELLAETHPGRTILEDVVKPAGMSVNALSKELHIPTTRLNDIVRGRRGVSATARSGWRDYSAPQRSFGSIFGSPYELRVAERWKGAGDQGSA